MMLLDITFDQGFATLIAATIAAIISLLTFISVRPTEIRAANRKSLESFITDISDATHQLVAISNILLKNKTEESRGNWREKAEQAKDKLKKIRPKIRYSLWGLEDHLLSLTRLPDYTLYTLEDMNVAKELVKRGSKLGNKIDACIRDCYLKGRSPRFYHLWIIKFYDWRYKKIRKDYRKRKN